jgi:phosphatidate cytidylyltransferase
MVLDRETRIRLVSAFFAVVLTLVSLILGGWVWVIYIMLVVIVAQSEFFRMMEAKGFRPYREIAIAVSLILLVVSYLGGIDFSAGILTGGILGILMFQLIRFRQGSAIPEISALVTSVIYLGWFPSYGIYLRKMHTLDDPEFGLFAVVFALAVTFLNDTGGYFVGRATGRTPLARAISPKKTVEGSLGGILFAVLTALFLKWLWERFIHPLPFSYLQLGVIGFLTAIVGLCGDLFESLIKRDAAVKDSGSIMPGHGGILDRIDGVLFTIPFVYYVFRLLLKTMEI